MNTPPNTYTIDPRCLKKNKTEFGCVIAFLVIWIPATIFTTLLVINFPDGFLYFWTTCAWFVTAGLLLNFRSIKRKISLRIEKDELIITGLKFSPRGEKRFRKQDVKALALEAYDEDSFLSLTLWKTGGILWRVPLTSFVHPRHMVTIFEDIKRFLYDNGFEFEARSSISPEEGWPVTGPVESSPPTHPKARRIVRNIVGMATGVVVTVFITGLSIIAATEIELHESAIDYYLILVLTMTATAFFIGGYVTAKVTRERGSYDVLVVGIISLCLFGASLLSIINKIEADNDFLFDFKIPILIYLLFLFFCSSFGGRIQKKRLVRAETPENNIEGKSTDDL